jgi:hypothetical protein
MPIGAMFKPLKAQQFGFEILRPLILIKLFFNCPSGFNPESKGYILH